MSDMTPTTDQVRDAYARSRQVFGDPERTYEGMADEFDQWFNKAVNRSLAAYQQISDTQERLSAGVNESRWPCGCRYSFYELAHPDEGHLDGDHRPEPVPVRWVAGQGWVGGA